MMDIIKDTYKLLFFARNFRNFIQLAVITDKGSGDHFVL